jgi:subtilisin family serine protease
VDETFIIFEVRAAPPRGPGGFGFDTATVDKPPEAVVHVAELTPAQAANERQRPGQTVARPLPTMLIKPVSLAETAEPAAATTSWGIDAVGAKQSPYDGSGVKVAVLDTGVADHEAFKDVNVVRKDFTGEGDEDKNGHGTHCAGTIVGRDVNGFRFGVAQGVEELLAGKVLGSDGGSTLGVAQGIQWAIENGANVISMSLGIDFPGAVDFFEKEGLPRPAATSRSLEGYRDTIRLFESVAEFVQSQAVFGRPAVIVAATGNESERTAPTPFSIGVSPPAAAQGFIAVGAVGQGGGGGFGIAPFSNAGASIVAPGVDITSAKPGGGFAKMSGTSMATPHVAGVAALWAEKLRTPDGRIDVAQLRAQIIASGRAMPDLGFDDVGSGLIEAPLV